MKILPILSILFALFTAAAPAAAADKAPSELGGFTLGDDIKDYADRLVTASVRPYAPAPFLKRVDVKPFPGFSSGYLLYGTCAAPGRIVRVKLRYADSGDFILAEINSSLVARYGQPVKIRDNTERTYICNKWALKNAAGNAVSIILQHYTGWSPEYDHGSSIKLADRTAIRAEQACFEKAHPAAAPSKDAAPKTALIPK